MVLSVNDIALRRGIRYGTVLVDLERRTLMDVLPDRSADTFARCLTEHTGAENKRGPWRLVRRGRKKSGAWRCIGCRLLPSPEESQRCVFASIQAARRGLDLVPRPRKQLQRSTNLRMDREAAILCKGQPAMEPD